MPGIDTITAAILEDARRQAEETLEEARSKAGDTVRQAEARAQKTAQALMDQAGQEAVEYGRRMESMADLTCRRERLEVKQRLLDELFDRALRLCTAWRMAITWPLSADLCWMPLQETSR